MSGTWTGRRAHAATFCHAGRVLRWKSNAMWRFPIQTTAKVAVVTAGAQGDRVANPAAQTSSATPLTSTHGAGSPNWLGTRGANTAGRTRCTTPLTVNAPITTLVPAGSDMGCTVVPRPPISMQAWRAFIPFWYCCGMAMTLRLSEEESDLLRQQAELEHRSMHEVVRLAVLDRIEATKRTSHIRELTREVMSRDAEALRLLGQ